MAVRSASRLLLLISLAVFLILTVSYLRPASPLSPEVRAPGHLPLIPDDLHHDADKNKDENKDLKQEEATSSNGGGGQISDQLLNGAVVMPHLGNETAKAELGRSAWRVLHTMMARFPDDPSREQQETLRSFVYLFARLYPCGECASHFQAQLAKFPPQVSSRSNAAGWACHVHNEVNKMLKKDIFDCSKIGDFYDCGCADDDDKKKTPGGGDGKPGERSGEGGKEKASPLAAGKDEVHNKLPEAELHPPKVEIKDEPATNG